VHYGLLDRGIRVVTGRNRDDDGSQSNGAGKSVLVMAPLWALTGRSDARSEVCWAASLAQLCHSSCMLACIHGPARRLPGMKARAGCDVRVKHALSVYGVAVQQYGHGWKHMDGHSHVGIMALRCC
jgi:hypothetical protein